VSIQELVGTIDRSIRALQAHARAQGGEAAGAPLGIYHGEVNEDSNGPVEICLTTEPPREIYLSAPGEAGPDEPFIEIAWPFR
jgi:hypothetical protein